MTLEIAELSEEIADIATADGQREIEKAFSNAELPKPRADRLIVLIERAARAVGAVKATLIIWHDSKWCVKVSDERQSNFASASHDEIESALASAYDTLRGRVLCEHGYHSSKLLEYAEMLTRLPPLALGLEAQPEAIDSGTSD